jgi:transcriptional regulator GlxA family with amidase domain
MFIVHPPNSRHGDIADSDYVLYHVQFEFDADPGWPRISTDDPAESVGSTLRAIVHEWYAAEPDREEMLRILAARMNLLLRRSTWHQAVPIAETVVAHAQGELRRRFGENITIDEVAASVGVSRSSLYSHFKTVLGKTPLEVLSELRVNNALFLLRHTHMGIGEIASASGFCSASHLSHRLRATTGLSPGKVRGSNVRRINKPAT